MILYVNACVRAESRTDRIARELLKKLGGEFTELKLASEDISPLSAETLEKRTALIEKQDHCDETFRYAKQFAQADVIVMAAPFWDLSFPALLKVYLENVYVTGIVSRYGEDGIPHGLCRAETLYFVTTSGGPYLPDFGYGQIKALAEKCFGIKKTKLIKAEMLDVDGFDAEKIVEETIAGLDDAIFG